MSQNTLIEKIKQDAAAQIAEIKATGQTRLEAIQRETDGVIVELNDSQKESLKKKMAQIELVAVSRAKQSGKIAIQQAKREQVNVLFSEVQAEVVAQSAELYTAFFSKLAAEIIPDSTDLIKVGAPANRAVETKDILTKLGLSGEVVVEDKIKAGFIAHTSDGMYDITLERLMNEKRSELEMEVIKEVMV